MKARLEWTGLRLSGNSALSKRQKSFLPKTLLPIPFHIYQASSSSPSGFLNIRGKSGWDQRVDCHVFLTLRYERDSSRRRRELDLVHQNNPRPRKSGKFKAGSEFGKEVRFRASLVSWVNFLWGSPACQPTHFAVDVWLTRHVVLATNIAIGRD